MSPFAFIIVKENPGRMRPAAGARSWFGSLTYNILSAARRSSSEITSRSTTDWRRSLLDAVDEVSGHLRAHDVAGVSS